MLCKLLINAMTLLLNQNLNVLFIEEAVEEILLGDIALVLRLAVIDTGQWRTRAAG